MDFCHSPIEKVLFYWNFTMPVIGRRPSFFIRENDELVILSSEGAKRPRGKTLFLDSVSKDSAYICYEQSSVGDRLGWITTFVENVPQDPTFVPILVREKDTEKGLSPQRVRYLRHAMNLEPIYFSETGEVYLYYWTNTFSPLNLSPTIEPCEPHLWGPVEKVSSSGKWSTWPKPKDQDFRPLFKTPEDPSFIQEVDGKISACITQTGEVTLRFKPTSLVSPNILWRNVEISLNLSRINIADLHREIFDLPEGGLPLDINPPEESLNGPFVEPDTRNSASLRAVISVNSGAFKHDYPVSWIGNLNSEGVELEPSDQNILKTYHGYVSLENPASSASEVLVKLQFNVDNPRKTKEDFLGILVSGISLNLTCANSQITSDPLAYPEITKPIPAPGTLPIDGEQPHAYPRTSPDERFNFAVGDLPKDELNGAYAGIYNRTDISSLLLVGGSEETKLRNPFFSSNDHQRLPESPGLILKEEVAKVGKSIRLSSLNDDMVAFSQFVYGMRETKDLQYATRTLMFARGHLATLLSKEDEPRSLNFTEQSGELRIGASVLAPAQVNTPYKGEDFTFLLTPTGAFPFGVPIIGRNGTSLRFSLGEVGHLFTAFGGTQPYKWTVRPTRSSSSDPVTVPIREGSSPDPQQKYRFKPDGTLDPDGEVPVSVMGGGLPFGMVLNSTGLLYGTPLEVGTHVFRVYVEDKNGLTGEATITINVGETDEIDPCYDKEPIPGDISRVQVVKTYLPPIETSDDLEGWVGHIEVIDGVKPYSYSFRGLYDNPKQNAPSLSGENNFLLTANGEVRNLGITPDNFDSFKGIWVWEVEVRDSSTERPTCEHRTVTLAVGVPLISRLTNPENPSTYQEKDPDGVYKQNVGPRTYLILDPPIPVQTFPQGKNVVLRGSNGNTMRSDLGGVFIGPGPVTSAVPGVVNPVGVIGSYEDEGSPAHVHSDFVVSNPPDLYRDVFDRLDDWTLPSSPPTPEGEPEPIVEDILLGSTIDQNTLFSKRTRGLWPV